jgi:UDP-galactopyranose mutase
MIEKMLDGIEVKTNTIFFENKNDWENLATRIVFTGRIDEYFNYQFGHLNYRTVRFETETLDMPDFQGNAVINYTDRETPFTRIIEHKHFEFGTQPKTVISEEFSTEWDPELEPFYPVNDDKNNQLYLRY